MKIIISYLSTFFLLLANLLSGQPTPEGLLDIAESTKSLDSAVVLYEKAFDEAFKKGKENFADSVLFALGKRYIGAGKLQEAREVADRGLGLYQGEKESPLASGFYNITAITFHHMHELDSALTYYLKAVEVLEAKNDTLKAAFIRFNIGNIFLSYRDWHQANEHFEILLDANIKYKDSTYLAGVLSALSATQFEMGNLKQSEIYAHNALEVAMKRKDALGQMLALRQIGQLANSNGDIEAAIKNYLQALSIAEKIGMPYYLALIKMNLCEAYSKSGNFDEAISVGTASLEHAKDPGFSTQLPTVYRYLSEAYEGNKDYKNALKYLNLATELKDETSSEENKKIVNELLVKYEAEKKDRRIAEQKLDISENKKRNNLYLSLGSIALLIIFFLLGMLWLRRKLNKSRLKQLEQEKEQEFLLAIVEGEEQERGRISNALHDSISNILFNCKLSLSSLLNVIPAYAGKIGENISLLDNVREETRRMSHNLLPLDLDKNSLSNALKTYIDRINDSTPEVEVFFQSYGEEKNKLSGKRKMILFRAIQELTGNAVRYANAKEIATQLFFEADHLKISIEDDGKGFEPKQSQSGQGLSLLENRIRLINGSCFLESTPGKGTQVNITVNY